MTSLQRQMLHDFNARPAPPPFGRFTCNSAEPDEGVLDAGAWRAIFAAAVCGGALIAVLMWAVWHIWR